MKNLADIINKVHCADCLDFMRDMPDECVDLVITDPPYGIGIAQNPFRQKFLKSDWDSNIPSEEVFGEIFRVSKNQVIWGANYFPLPPSSCFYVWDKLQPENFSSAMCEMAWSSKPSPAKLFRKRVISYPKFHPTTKPVELMIWILEMFPDARTILDPFLGSGTTAVAAKQLGRNFIGVEINPEYCKIAEERLKQEVLPFNQPKPEPQQENRDLFKEKPPGGVK